MRFLPPMMQWRPTQRACWQNVQKKCCNAPQWAVLQLKTIWLTRLIVLISTSIKFFVPLWTFNTSAQMEQLFSTLPVPVIALHTIVSERYVPTFEPLFKCSSRAKRNLTWGSKFTKTCSFSPVDQVIFGNICSTNVKFCEWTSPITNKIELNTCSSSNLFSQLDLINVLRTVN